MGIQILVSDIQEVLKNSLLKSSLHPQQGNYPQRNDTWSPGFHCGQSCFFQAPDFTLRWAVFTLGYTTPSPSLSCVI